MERRLIYLIMIVAVAIPILFEFSWAPSRLVSAERMYQVIEDVRAGEGEIALVWLDFGPGTIAENQPQAEVILEHLFRRRIPVVVLSQYQLAEAVLNSIPADIASRLEHEMPGQSWRYGEAWINAGYQPGGAQMMQNLAAAENLSKYFGRDVNGMPFTHYPTFAALGGIEKVKLVAEVTGLVGVFDTIIQFFQKSDYRPTLVHGCTSITIPEAYIFLDSKQLHGLLEGIAGAAWYSELLKRNHPESQNDRLLVRNTALIISHLVLMMLIVAGNIVGFVRARRSSDG